MKFNSYLLFISLSVFSIPCLAQNSVSQQKFQVPVLKGKDLNPVLRIMVSLKDQEEQILTAVTVNASAATDLNDIESMSLLSLGQDSSIASADQFHHAPVFAQAVIKGQRSILLTGSMKIKKGANYFWLTVKLKPAANLQHFIDLGVNAVTINNQTLQVKMQEQPVVLRIGTALRQHLQDKVHTHRIPGMATANDGSLLAIYDARHDLARDLQGNIDIGLSRSTDKGKSWLPMQIVLDMGTWGGLPQKFNGVSDANILVDKNSGTIYIAGLWMYGLLDEKGKWIADLTADSTLWNHQWRAKGSQPGFEAKQTAQFLIIKSTDQGKTWSEPVNLTKMCKQKDWWLWAPAPGSGITMKDGTLVFPTQGRDANGRPFSNLTYSKDRGKTWKTSKAAAPAEATSENMVVELTDGTLMLNMRANTNRTDTSSTNGRAVSTTADLGESWKIHPSSHRALQEPTCMASIIRHDYTIKGEKKSMLVFCNPDSKIGRKNMTIKVSYDDGKTWLKKILLDEQKSRAYSCLTSIDAETIGVVYESSQADLVFQTIKLTDLL